MLDLLSAQPGRPHEPALFAIAPGLASLITARQIAIFPAFRAAMLEDAGYELALRGANWLGRDQDDFGVMLTEMFAYVCDVLAFYDGLTANEAYLRTAQRPEALHRLAALIGYIPRPAVAAEVDLALTLEGRLPVSVPGGTAFRSGSFTGSTGEEKPQVFTALDAATFHPLRAKWTLVPQPTSTLGGWLHSLVCKRGSVTLKAGDAALVHAGLGYAASLISDVENVTDEAGNAVTRVLFTTTVVLPPATSLADLTLERPIATAYVNDVWFSGGSSGTMAKSSHAGSAWVESVAVMTQRVLVLDALYRAIKADDIILLRRGSFVRWFTVAVADTTNWTVQAAKTITSKIGTDTMTTTVPAVTMPVTRLELKQSLTSSLQRAPEDTASWDFNAPNELTLYFGMKRAGVPVGEAAATINPTDSLRVRERVETVAPDYEPDQFILRDLDEQAILVDGALAADGTLTVADDGAWAVPLTPPVTAYGALLRATRGERVTAEVLGLGDGSVANQTFTLKKKPLTYYSDATSASGVRSSLQIDVDGVRWREVPSLYGRRADERVYTIRQDEAGESLIAFGDGVRGERLTTGSRVVGSYYYGAGQAVPPALAITQMVRPVKGITAIINPIGAVGGADAEDASNIRAYAPRSALSFGRAVSLVDYEAVAASVAGVRVALAEWRWSGVQQRPVVKLWFIGAASLGATIAERLRGVSAEGVPFEVTAATPVEKTLHVALVVDPDYLPDPVIAAVVDVLRTALAPEVVGIGGAVIRSKVLALVASVEGVVAPISMFIDGAPYLNPGYRPPTGYYADLIEITAGVDA